MKDQKKQDKHRNLRQGLRRKGFEKKKFKKLNVPQPPYILKLVRFPQVVYVTFEHSSVLKFQTKHLSATGKVIHCHQYQFVTIL